MKAIVITGVGGPEVLELQDVPTPEPQGDQIRVRVRAAGVNRADLMQAMGGYPAPKGAPTDIPGLEYAGEVDALGPNVAGPLQVGDRVFGIVSGGGLAEWVVTPERMAVRIPEQLDFVQAAAVPEVFLTAHDALDARAEVRSGERVLIHAIGGGVGSAAVQIARAMGCQVFGTTRTPAKLEKAFSMGLGLDVGIDVGSESFVEVINTSTRGEGVHVVIDHVGGPLTAGNMEAVATRGRIVQVGLLGGSVTTIDLRILMAKRITLVGTTLRARPVEEKIAATQAFAARVVPWLERGVVQPILDRVYPAESAKEALERVKSNLGFGKVVLTF